MKDKGFFRQCRGILSSPTKEQSVPAARTVIAGDIGGTSSRFALFSWSTASELNLVKTVWLKTAGASSFSDLLRQLSQADLPIQLRAADYVCLGIAGPVEGGVFCRPPQISWTADLVSARSEFNLKNSSLINDFLAQAYSCCSSIALNAVEILPGVPTAGGAIGVIGAGTGLGKALLLADGVGRYLGGASEGGHANFAPESERELDFSKFVADRLGGVYATWDDVVSGKGISLLHEYLSGARLEPSEVAKLFSAESETLQWFSRFYGRVCRNFALETLATGGLFVAGGIAAKNPSVLRHSAFAESFYCSRVHEKLLQRVPVKLLDNEESGLWGAAQCGVSQLGAVGIGGMK